jgi:hypothetical protein
VFALVSSSRTAAASEQQELVDKAKTAVQEIVDDAKRNHNRNMLLDLKDATAAHNAPVLAKNAEECLKAVDAALGKNPPSTSIKLTVRAEGDQSSDTVLDLSLARVRTEVCLFVKGAATAHTHSAKVAQAARVAATQTEVVKEKGTSLTITLLGTMYRHGKGLQQGCRRGHRG